MLNCQNYLRTKLNIPKYEHWEYYIILCTLSKKPKAVCFYVNKIIIATDWLPLVEENTYVHVKIYGFLSFYNIRYKLYLAFKI